MYNDKKVVKCFLGIGNPENSGHRVWGFRPGDTISIPEKPETVVRKDTVDGMNGTFIKAYTKIWPCDWKDGGKGQKGSYENIVGSNGKRVYRSVKVMLPANYAEFVESKTKTVDVDKVKADLVAKFTAAGFKGKALDNAVKAMMKE